MSLIIPQKLRALVEGYVIKSGNRALEKGGYLIGRENTITAFVPVPNGSKESHANTYFLDSGWRPLGDEFAKMVNSEVIGDLHTHPNGTVPSEQDGRYVRGMPWPYHVVLSDKGDTFDWYCIDSGLRGIALVESDTQLEGIMELMAGELSMADLGRLFVTPGGEILSTKKEILAFVQVDSDVLAVWQWSKGKNAYYVTAAYASRELKMPYPRALRAFKKLGLGKK